MAAGDSKGGSDLDVFEGLGKKTSTRAPASAPRTSALPPPPPSLRSPDAQKPQPPPPPSLGFAETAAAPPRPPSMLPRPPSTVPHAQPPHTATLPSAAGVAAAPAPSTPGPRTAPPSRASLPAVVAPPSKTPSTSSSPAMNVKSLSSPPPPNSPAPAGSPAASPARPAAAAAGGLDMDWDEEEEATHVLDRDAGGKDMFPPPGNNGFRPPPGPSPKQTLLGLSGAVHPPPPPSARPPSLPPPPPSAQQAYARPAAPPQALPRASTPPPPPASIRPAAPPPVIPPPAAPPPSMQANGGAASSFPYQQTTTPMAMPPRVVSSRAHPSLSAVPDEVTALPQFSRSRMEATALLRPQQRPTGLIIGAGVAVLVLILGILFVMPHSGQIAVNVSDSKGGAVKNLQISVDGKLQCDSAPCLVHNLSAGSHTVKVEATGYEALADKAVAVESGKDQAVAFQLSPLSPSGGTGVKVTGGQPGEKLYVDDREVGALPQEIHDLTPGSHRVRVSGGDRYAAVERTVTVAKDEFQDLGTVTLKVIKGRATVSLATPGAKVFLVSGSDRRELPTLPMQIDLDPAKQWTLVATKAGYADYTQVLSFDDGQAEKAFVITLDPKTASPATGSMSFSPPPQTYTPPPVAAYHPPPAAATHESHAASPAAASGGGGEGTLNMNSIPASSVVLDGKPLGSTPQIGITVSAGTHTVLFVNADQGFKKQVSVTVSAGETKKVHP
jgi:hypothetical protein